MADERNVYQEMWHELRDCIVRDIDEDDYCCCSSDGVDHVYFSAYRDADSQILFFMNRIEKSYLCGDDIEEAE